MTTECSICFNDTAELAATMLVNGVTYVLCEDCSGWGYLRCAEENRAWSAKRREERIEGARNACQWGGRAARRYAPSWPLGGGMHLDRNKESAL